MKKSDLTYYINNRGKAELFILNINAEMYNENLQSLNKSRIAVE